MLPLELWDRICSISSEDYEGGETLVALAQTSRSLHEAATRHIWSHIPNIGPLMGCLPADVWGPSRATTKKLLREIQPPDLTRLQMHANLVRSYGHWHEGGWREPEHEVGIEVYQRLCSLVTASGHTLFPNIRQVVLDWEDPGIAACIQNLLADRICGSHRVSPILEGDSSALSTLDHCRVMAKILSDCSCQQELVLTPIDHNHVVEGLSERSCIFASSLRSLETGPIPPDALAHIAMLPSLEVLNISMGRNKGVDRFHTEQIPQTECYRYFPSLRKLDISCEGTSVCLSLLKLLAPNFPLVKAKFECANARSAGFKQLISLISERCDSTTLIELNVGDRYTWHDWSEGDDESFGLEHIEPILKFRNLKRLDMDIHGAFNLNDAMIERMARSWPNIGTLRLYSDNRGAPREVTLQGIQTLAKYCPELDLLTMYFNARLPVGGPPKLKEPSTCKLDELNVIYSPIKGVDPEMVASFLRDSFPHLTRFSQWDDGGCTAFYEWDDVQSILGLED